MTTEGHDGPGDWTPDEKQKAARQRNRIYAIMCDWQWRTLAELHALTHDPEASISARLRDFRKEKFGGYEVLRDRLSGGIYRYRIVQPSKAVSE